MQQSSGETQIARLKQCHVGGKEPGRENKRGYESEDVAHRLGLLPPPLRARDEMVKQVPPG